LSEDQPQPAASSGFRASDEDRERVISELGEHLAAGRLSTEELEERTHAAYTARTRGELEALWTDLPTRAPDAAVADAERRRHLSRRLLQQTGGSAALFVVCTVIWLTSGANGQFWPVWVLIVVAMSLVRNGWALYGPAPDLDAVEDRLDRDRQRRDRRAQRRIGR